MIEFLTLVAVGATAYFAWRIVDQLPDVLYRLSEIQRDVAELRRRGQDDQTDRLSEIQRDVAELQRRGQVDQPDAGREKADE